MRTTAIDLTIRATRSVELYHYRRAVLRPRQIAYLPLIAVVPICELAPTARANQLPVSTLAPHPQLQRLGWLIDFVLVDPISRPSQHPRPVVFSHRSASVTRVVENPKCPLNLEVLQIPVQSPSMYGGVLLYLRDDQFSAPILALPSSVSLLAIGFSCPHPAVVIRAPSIPPATSKALIASARSTDSFLFDSGSPVLSV